MEITRDVSKWVQLNKTRGRVFDKREGRHVLKCLFPLEIALYP